MNDLLVVARAFNFASQRHSKQRRKGEAQEPYINHLAEVALLVTEATKGEDPNLVAAALLHDAVEDTPTTYEELAAIFNDDIANLVSEVTDDKTLRKAERKKLQITNAPKKSHRARILKLADKTSNLRSIAKSPPEHWDRSRKLEYIEWAIKVVSGLQGVPQTLQDNFDTAVSNARKSI